MDSWLLEKTPEGNLFLNSVQHAKTRLHYLFVTLMSSFILMVSVLLFVLEAELIQKIMLALFGLVFLFILWFLVAFESQMSCDLSSRRIVEFSKIWPFKQKQKIYEFALDGMGLYVKSESSDADESGDGHELLNVYVVYYPSMHIVVRLFSCRANCGSSEFREFLSILVDNGWGSSITLVQEGIPEELYAGVADRIALRAFR